MRLGQNPAKSIKYVAKPAPVTVAVTSYIPFPSGYYAQSLDVLKICLESIIQHTDQPFDLLVFDNASCPEAIEYLCRMRAENKIQYLVLSEKNIGVVGAWNFVFGAAPGEYIAYSDMDVYYYPGWLSRHMQIFGAFPEAGTVAGLPRREDNGLYSSTLEQAPSLPGVTVDQGDFIRPEWVTDHLRSLGKPDEVEKELATADFRLTRDGVSAYATATHFQFVVPTRVAQSIIPLEYDRPMGDPVSNFDRTIDGNRYLRLAVSERVVRHIGNTIDEKTLAELPESITSALDTSKPRPKVQEAGGIYQWKPVKWLLHRTYDWIFRKYYAPRTK